MGRFDLLLKDDMVAGGCRYDRGTWIGFDELPEGKGTFFIDTLVTWYFSFFGVGELSGLPSNLTLFFDSFVSVFILNLSLGALAIVRSSERVVRS